MRRAAALLACVLAGSAAQAQTIEPYTFGMNYNYPLVTVSRMAPSIMRMWDESAAGAGVHWQDIETCQAASGDPGDPCYNWTAFDAVLAKEQSIGADTIYALGQVPPWANGNGDQSVPPTSTAFLLNFVQAVLTRAAGRIKYLEEWNEPDQPLTWSGTQAQLIAQSTAVYNYVHANFPGVTVLGPSFDILPASIVSYYAAGLGAYTDVDVAHLYPQVGQAGIPNTVPPEQIYTTLQQILSTLSYYGDGSKPFFADEGGGGDSILSLTDDMKTRWAAVWPLLMASAGTSRILPYSYDNTFGIGRLQDTASGPLNRQGVAYKEALKWLMGATFTSPIARVPNTSQVRNPSAAGAVAGTPGTLPTDWGSYTPDSAKGVTTQIVGTGTENGVPYIDWRVHGTATSGATGQTQLDFEQTTHIASPVGHYWTAGAYIKLQAGSLAGCTIYLNFVDDDVSGNYLGTDLALPLAPSGAPLQTDQNVFTAPTLQLSVAYVLPYVTVTYAVGTPFDVTLRIGAPSMDDGTIWTGSITKSGGYQGQIVWSAADGTSSYSTSFSYWRNGAGNAGPVVGGTVALTNQPMLLESQPYKPYLP